MTRIGWLLVVFLALVTLKSEDHWLSRGATRLQMLQASVAFLEKNNPPN